MFAFYCFIVIMSYLKMRHHYEANTKRYTVYFYPGIKQGICLEGCKVNDRQRLQYQCEGEIILIVCRLSLKRKRRGGCDIETLQKWAKNTQS